MNKNADWLELLRETVAAMRDPRTDREALRAEWRKLLDCKSSDDGSCSVGNRLCDRGWMSWRQNGTMQAARCKCGRANWRQGPT